MDFGKTIMKAILGALTFGISYLAANTEFLTSLLPENISQMTIGAAIAAIVVGIANYLKNKKK